MTFTQTPVTRADALNLSGARRATVTSVQRYHTNPMTGVRWAHVTTDRGSWWVTLADVNVTRVA